jgi:hypothetical protein
MGSFYNDASLVMIPSGYKDQKVYCAKPADGSGDLVFSRASSATRVQSDGLIEKVRTNLLLYSQEFDNAYWLKQVGGLASAPVVTANAELAPDGTMTAERIVFNLNGGTLSTDISQLESATITASAQENTGSVYLKTTDGTSKVFSMVNPDGTLKTITVTGTYQRFTNTSSSASAGSFRLRLRGNESTADSASIAAWGAQFESGVATDYIPTTTAAVSVGPVSGLPRLDYLNSTCPKLLLEPQRTNLFNFSENFDNAYWSVIGSLTITANTNVSPDGYTNADRVTTTAAPARIQRAFTGLTAGTRTLSCFVKAGTGSTFRINTFDGIVDRGATFNVATGAVTSTGTGVTATITNYGNGWYRTTHNYTSAGTSYSCQFFFDDVGTYQVYGFQFEDLVSYATSYIPTLGASVTRGADAASKTGISSLIGQTEGTLFLDFESGANDSIDYAFTLNDGTTTNRIRISRGAGNTITAQIRVAAVTQALIQTATVTPNTRFKCALAYKLDDVALYVNGAEIGVDTSSTIPACSVLATNLGDGTGLFGRPINQVLLFKTRLTNAQLAELTTI